jgi:hypothetical protein
MFCCRARAGPSLYRMQVCGGPVQARRYLCRYLCHILDIDEGPKPQINKPFCSASSQSQGQHATVRLARRAGAGGLPGAPQMEKAAGSLL